jgi:hypothetical protein
MPITTYPIQRIAAGNAIDSAGNRFILHAQIGGQVILVVAERVPDSAMPEEFVYVIRAHAASNWAVHGDHTVEGLPVKVRFAFRPEHVTAFAHPDSFGPVEE